MKVWNAGSCIIDFVMLTNTQKHHNGKFLLHSSHFVLFLVNIGRAMDKYFFQSDACLPEVHQNEMKKLSGHLTERGN